MPLTPEDHALSMAISPRANRPEDNADLRTLIIHRLVPAEKAVGRFGLRNDLFGMYCEPCGTWTSLGSLDDPPPEWKCDGCGRTYAAETVVYSEVE